VTTPVLSVVIPVYNEEHRIGATLAAIAATLKRRRGSSELIVVDDGSRDATVSTVNAICVLSPVPAEPA